MGLDARILLIGQTFQRRGAIEPGTLKMTSRPRSAAVVAKFADQATMQT